MLVYIVRTAKKLGDNKRRNIINEKEKVSIMDALTELLIYVKCICNNCGNRWESKVWVGKCPECHSENINQNAMMSGL